MFEGLKFPKSLDEALFESWLEVGRQSPISYNYLLVIWDEWEEKYRPVLIENREEIDNYDRYGDTASRELLVAAYDLYSESRVR